MKKKTVFLLIAIVTGVCGMEEVHAQDPHYSQFYSNLSMLNPAFTGSGIGHRVAFNYRAQWVGIPGYYKQIAFSYDVPVYFLGTTQGLGVTFESDVAGEGRLGRLNARLNYAYQLELVEDHYLRFGLTGGIQQASIDFFQLRFPDQITRDGVTGPTREPGAAGGLNSQLRPDVGAGLAYFNNNAWIGATLSHITQPVQRFYDFPLPEGTTPRLPMKITATAGVAIPLETGRSRKNVGEKSIIPTVLYMRQGDFRELNLGMYVNLQPMVFGVWYRTQDAVVGLMGLSVGNFRFGYSYDYSIQGPGQINTAGSHEVSVVIELEKEPRQRRRTYKDLPCPKF